MKQPTETSRWRGQVNRALSLETEPGLSVQSNVDRQQTGGEKTATGGNDGCNWRDLGEIDCQILAFCRVLSKNGMFILHPSTNRMLTNTPEHDPL